MSFTNQGAKGPMTFTLPRMPRGTAQEMELVQMIQVCAFKVSSHLNEMAARLGLETMTQIIPHGPRPGELVLYVFQCKTAFVVVGAWEGEE